MSVAGEARRRKKAAEFENEPAFRGVADAKNESVGSQLPCTALPPPEPAALLAWYDRHRRVLPWRARPGAVADPYRVWLSEIMLQQTTVRAVAPYYAGFLERFPTVEKLAAAPLDDVLKAWAGLGYYARARNLHACAKAVVTKYGGHFPDSEDALRALPGIGAYTAAAIAAIAFDRRATPVDGNVERVIARLYAVDEPLPAAKPIIRSLAERLTPARRAGDFAQSVMDLGSTICTPKTPACILCAWNASCAARLMGRPELYPRKLPKREGELRRGAAFVVVRDDAYVLLRTRPESGLLGGMSEVPTTAWRPDFADRLALQDAPALASGGAAVKWRKLSGIVTHTFTHFPLELMVYVATVPAGACAPAGTRWVAATELAGEALPNVMRKVLAHVPPALLTPGAATK
jgi:A/G-specific adenine glycosylase